MRKWCAAAAIATLFALPLFAQQKDDNPVKPPAEASAVADAPAAQPDATPATRGVFALPVAPKATPFPGRSSCRI